VKLFTQILSQLLSVVILLISFALGAQDHRSMDCKQINVAGPDQWSPNSYFDAKSQSHQGLGYVLLQKIADKQQIPFQILQNLPWKRVLKYTEEGNVDLIVAIYQSEERERFIEFSEPYFTNNIKIYVYKGREFRFNALTDLQGKKGLYPSGASYGDKFDSFAKNLDLEGKTNISELFMYLSRNTVDYAIQESTVANVFITANKLEKDVVALPQSLLNVPVRLGFSRNSGCNKLVDKFKTEFKKMLDNGELADLQVRYLNPQLSAN
jgi:polar amino acid transport system substrate-binding protein